MKKSLKALRCMGVALVATVALVLSACTQAAESDTLPTETTTGSETTGGDTGTESGDGTATTPEESESGSGSESSTTPEDSGTGDTGGTPTVSKFDVGKKFTTTITLTEHGDTVTFIAFKGINGKVYVPFDTQYILVNYTFSSDNKPIGWVLYNGKDTMEKINVIYTVETSKFTPGPHYTEFLYVDESPFTLSIVDKDYNQALFSFSLDDESIWEIVE